MVTFLFDLLDFSPEAKRVVDRLDGTPPRMKRRLARSFGSKVLVYLQRTKLRYAWGSEQAQAKMKHGKCLLITLGVFAKLQN